LALFKRNKDAYLANDSVESEDADQPRAKKSRKASQVKARDPKETSPQRVGVVSGILSTSAEILSDEASPFNEVVERRFAPDPARPKEDKPPASEIEPSIQSFEAPELEIDPIARIGHGLTIAGDIVSEEDLEIYGRVEGSVRLPNHCVSVGPEATVMATVEAHKVVVEGTITGNVVATLLVEIRSGGVIGGDVHTPRLLMEDGAIMDGAIDMSSTGSRRASTAEATTTEPSRPAIKKVHPPFEAKSEEVGR
jgi:cytoskeletal protein CcmA (bactofilin family)